MVHKATKALGPLKSYDLELKVLQALLDQKIWMRGKRARWYERRAIVQGHLTRQVEGIDTKHGLLWQTMEGVKDALRDEDTGIGVSRCSNCVSCTITDFSFSLASKPCE
jgi:Fanconi-associated nuclease 1